MKTLRIPFIAIAWEVLRWCMKEMTTGLLRVSKNKHTTDSNQGVVHLLEACIRSITLQYKIIITLEKRVQLRMQMGRLKVTFKLM
jgi:hypothetical protein